MRFAFGLLLAVAACSTASAEDPPAPPPPPWSGEISAGSVVTTGNSESATLNAKGEVIYQSKIWRNTLNGLATKTESTDAVTGDDVVTAERYLLGNKTDFNFTDKDYAFLAIEGEKDLVGPTRERTSETVGYGRKILNGVQHKLEAEIGAGARQTEAQVTEETESEAVGRLRVAYKWDFSETSYFGETLKVESGSSNTTSESVTELRMSLVGTMFALASYTARTNSDVPAGTEKTDTITALSLGWTFGK